ncbi:dynamin-like GTPase family protein [Helicobacter pylori]|uniref:dynamin-like GTPase family protein n=1 Tax=Helicobacter pylori TaxID=210 RepID=UPI000EAF73F8|nr:dynamin-like GTPase family protein [Helicobacter pylori]
MSVNFFNGNDRGKNHHHLGSLEERYDLIARILNAKIENEGLIQYQRILDNEFLKFANEVDSLKGEALALLALQEIQKELQLVAGYPSLFQKTIVAVGGGFSAGKSTFLNNLLDLKLKLPEDINPTTAIPTYCLKGKREVLMGFSQNGGMVELPHLAFDRAFLDSLGFNLKEIMPFMLLSAPSMPFEFLCFIDTPGHNPGNQGYTSEDKEASKEYLRHAQHILWLINCECGEIQRDDLERLQELYDEGKQVFIVLSRADRRTKSQLEEIANKIKETLEDHGIEFLGICAHSSTRYQEYKEFSEKSPVFNSLEEFLKKLNKRSEKQKEILGYLYNVFWRYERDIKRDASQFKRYQSELRSVELDFMQKGFDDFSDKIFRRIEILEKEFFQQEQSKRENLAQLNEVINLFKESIDAVFDSASAFTWEKYKEQNGNEEDEEENYREFEEIQKMVLFFRDRSLFYLDCYDLNKKQTKREKKNVDYNNEFLQLHYSLENLQTLREFKEAFEESYQKSLNDEEFQKDFQEWRDLRNTPTEENYREFEEIQKMVLYFRDRSLFYLDWYKLNEEEIQKERDSMDYDNELLQLDYSLGNLLRLKRYKERNNGVYQDCLNDERLQNDLREWRKWRKREFEEIKEMILFFRDFQEFSMSCNYNLSRKEIQDYSEAIARHNNMLQLDYSPENFYEFKRFKEVNEKDYENLLNDEKLQNKLQKWIRSKQR